MTDPTTVLVLSPGTSGHYFGEMLSGLTREVAAVGGRVVLVQTLGPGASTDELIDPPDFSAPVGWAEVDGAVAITIAVRGTYLQRLRDAGTPVVVAGARIDGFDAPLALPDNRDGTVAAVEHLIAHGHTRIGFVGNLRRSDVRERFAAYRSALESDGLVADPALVFVSGNSDLGGARAAQDVLAAPELPGALMVATDRTAIGLMRTLGAAGLVVPRDIAVMSFGNIEAGAFSTPTLSSVNQRFDEVGALAGRLVLATIRGQAVPFAAFSSPAAGIALRGSCGCAPDVPGEQAFGPAMAIPVWPPPSPREELSELLRGALLTYDSAAGGPTEDAVLAMAAEVAVLLESGDSVSTGRMEALAASLHRIAPDLSMLHRTVGALTEYLQRTGTSAAADGSTPAAARLAAALWRMQAGSFRGQSASFEAALDEQVAVDEGLLEAAGADPRLLGWLAGTRVHAGVLALWEDGPAAGWLRVAGSYDPHGVLPDLLGTAMTTEQFPPAALIAATQPDEQGLCFVVPVRTPDRDWGLLAVVGPINPMSERETYHHWAALLCASLESAGLADAVRESEERYALAARATNDGLWEWETRTGNVYFSDRCCTLLGIALDRRPDRLVQWERLVHPDDQEAMRRGMRTSGAGQRETVESEYRVRTADGSYRWMLARALGVRSADGSVERVVGSLSDVNDRRSLEDQLRRSALHDALTGLPNRRLFLERLEEAVERRAQAGTPFAVLFLDLDGFKMVNDSLGHQMGDRLLSAVGSRIEHQVRAVDTGARFGGDEFAVLLDDIAPGDVLDAALALQAALAEPLSIEGHDFTIRASLGIATSAVEYAAAEDVLRDADTAMYHAKETERGSVAFFDAAMHADVVHQMVLQSEIRRALDEQQFEVHYQPIVDLASGRTDRFEALVRWRHPERGLVPPEEFLPAMAETGLIVQLGHWVIDEVCDRLARWGPGVANVSVNVSDREFWHIDLLTYVLECLRRHGLEADRLTLDITEGVIMRRPEFALRIMREMHDAGLRLHLDDFGTGYSSLAMLHRFPVDAFKTDLDIIGGLTIGGRSADLVGALVAMGGALDLTMIAQGIETPEQLAVLQRIGCSTGQGFLFTPAVTGDQAPDLLGRVLREPRSDGGAN